jgi:hypothetical protein
MDEDRVIMLTIKNLAYIEVSGTLIDMDVSVDDGAPFRFTYHPDDNAQVSAAVRELFGSGSYKIAPYVPPPEKPKALKPTTGTGSGVIA